MLVINTRNKDDSARKTESVTWAGELQSVEALSYFFILFLARDSFWTIE